MSSRAPSQALHSLDVRPILLRYLISKGQCTTCRLIQASRWSAWLVSCSCLGLLGRLLLLSLGFSRLVCSGRSRTACTAQPLAGPHFHHRAFRSWLCGAGRRRISALQGYPVISRGLTVFKKECSLFDCKKGTLSSRQRHTYGSRPFVAVHRPMAGIRAVYAELWSFGKEVRQATLNSGYQRPQGKE